MTERTFDRLIDINLVLAVAVCTVGLWVFVDTVMWIAAQP